ncbi:MAG: hypothetical protein ALECFALPRED_001867 [Alectoria fallacina]|uniref:Uncharacterized protein n=1 Tax=Alectoria fallacina TaxID=1903189 RepID=A0A8H3FFE3_9LECA|nr:MAG: hypothetical protein ALECFALPRED_001867 [Alectoria fallacina]
MKKGNTVLIIGAGCTGLALAHGQKKVCTGCFESRRDMYFQVNAHVPTKDLDTLPFHNGRTGEIINGIQIGKLYRLCRSKLQALLSAGLDVDWEKKIVDIAYMGKRLGVNAVFDDDTEVTGSVLVGADGGRSSVRSFLVGPDIAKPTPID